MWGINLAILTNMLQYVFRKCKYCRKHKGSGKCKHFRKFAPFYLILLASFCIMADPTRHVLNDLYGWLPMYKPHSDETLNATGWIFSVFLTWFGYFLLFWGILWAIRFPQKLRAKWRKIRAAHKLKKSKSSASQMPLASTVFSKSGDKLVQDDFQKDSQLAIGSEEPTPGTFPLPTPSDPSQSSGSAIRTQSDAMDIQSPMHADKTPVYEPLEV